MNEIIAMLMLLFLICVASSLFYWQIFYPVILKRIRFHLFEMRDEARSLAADHGWANLASYQEVERFICKTIGFVPHINLMSFVFFVAAQKKRSPTKIESKQFEKDAPIELIKLRDGTARDAVLMMMLNSPWQVLFAVVPAPVLWALGKLSRTRIYSRTEDFVDNIDGNAKFA